MGLVDNILPENQLVWEGGHEKDLLIEKSLSSYFSNKLNGEKTYVWSESVNGLHNSLICKGDAGEKWLTVPGKNERDFIFHGDSEMTLGQFADHIAKSTLDSGANHIRIPMLSLSNAQTIVRALESRLPDYVFAVNLSDLIPYIDPDAEDFAISKSLKRAASKSKREDFTLDHNPDGIPSKIQKMHVEKWGPNRADSYFNFLNFLVEQDYTYCPVLYNKEKEVIGFQINIITDREFQYYYSVSNPSIVDGAGTIIMGISYEEYLRSQPLRLFSFGRGAEQYKFRYANKYKEVYELKGFYQPLKTSY